jgi:hypothetical protein
MLTGGEAGAAEGKAETFLNPDGKEVSKNNRYRKDKPWDHDGIDHWKIEPLTFDQVHGNCVVEETSFSTLFPKYVEDTPLAPPLSPLPPPPSSVVFFLPSFPPFLPQ